MAFERLDRIRTIIFRVAARCEDEATIQHEPARARVVAPC